MIDLLNFHSPVVEFFVIDVQKMTKKFNFIKNLIILFTNATSNEYHGITCSLSLLQ